MLIRVSFSSVLDEKTETIIYKDIELEEYLRGVIPAEVPALWPKDVLKAQAIASRTYALYCIDHPRHTVASICTTSHCQNYNLDKIHCSSDEAIKETEDLVLIYKGKIINSLYHACCDGHTKSNGDVFKGKNVPYLAEVKCSFTPTEKIPQSGHQVGMCQRGALAMVQYFGCSYEEILKYYYTGVEIVRYKNEFRG